MTGLYIHVPFCVRKCPYCDFYSLPLPDDSVLDAYTDEVCRRLAAHVTTPCDTLYFGGGTPSLLGGKRLARIIRTARKQGLTDTAEITLEANPAESLYDTFAAFTAEGGNRLSLGMQAADSASLDALGRRHTPAQLETAVADAHRAGITNVSLDIMLATPSQTRHHVAAAVERCVSLGTTHVSAYLLKTEPGTPFYDKRDQLSLPDEDDTAALYLYCCELLDRAGYAQYEISNFAKPAYESRHNLKYWNGDEYIGIGPSAHGFENGRRYAQPRSLDAFLKGEPPAFDDDDDIESGSEEEYAMLRLRLTAGLSAKEFKRRFGNPLPKRWKTAATTLPSSLVTVNDDGISLTRDGFLLSNAIITRILW